MKYSGVVKCSAVQYSAVQCSAVQCSAAVKCSALQCSSRPVRERGELVASSQMRPIGTGLRARDFSNNFTVFHIRVAG